MLDLAKLIHEAIGIESPRLFIAFFALFGLLGFGALGWIIDRGYRVKLQEQSPKSIGSFQVVQQAARERAAELKRATVVSTPSETLEVSSPDDVRVRLRPYHQPETGIDGLLVNVINDRPNNLRSCRIIVRDARSFDARRSIFREGFGLKPVRVAACPEIFAGDEARLEWFLRIVDGNLELGNGGGSVLRWPTADPSEVQTWLLAVTLEADNLTPWSFEVRMEWTRQSNALKVGLP
jgi:hypothetical protein